MLYVVDVMQHYTTCRFTPLLHHHFGTRTIAAYHICGNCGYFDIMLFVYTYNPQNTKAIYS